ncbi:MAG TPA: hypothetical protein VN977_00350 [Candidatus Binatia bacterium]|nr:hypothetical protein [Candidatus Binatia bacterium]
MPDNWGFVLAAYGLAAVVLIAYWCFLFRREKELEDATAIRHDLRQPSRNPASERPSP